MEGLIVFVVTVTLLMIVREYPRRVRSEESRYARMWREIIERIEYLKANGEL